MWTHTKYKLGITVRSLKNAQYGETSISFSILLALLLRRPPTNLCLLDFFSCTQQKVPLGRLENKQELKESERSSPKQSVLWRLEAPGRASGGHLADVGNVTTTHPPGYPPSQCPPDVTTPCATPLDSYATERDSDRSASIWVT